MNLSSPEDIEAANTLSNFHEVLAGHFSSCGAPEDPAVMESMLRVYVDTVIDKPSGGLYIMNAWSVIRAIGSVVDSTIADAFGTAGACDPPPICFQLFPISFKRIISLQALVGCF